MASALGHADVARLSFARTSVLRGGERTTSSSLAALSSASAATSHAPIPTTIQRWPRGANQSSPGHSNLPTASFAVAKRHTSSGGLAFETESGTQKREKRRSQKRSIFCCSSSETPEVITEARKVQMDATEMLAELLKAKDPGAKARENVESLTEEFFMIASTYLDLAKKEGNIEVTNQLETTLKLALEEKEKTLRPEIRVLNILLRGKSPAERADTIAKNRSHFSSDSYFFTLLNRMIQDVERQKTNAQRAQLLAQLRAIRRETQEVSKSMKRTEQK
ncbi:hypothetical protein CBR_g8349 [Chara braunii]|uniref:Uncharacterized protein n=1 Tax=Chara braunii TaxID=69332 RepID=A0A388KLX0_CHABU|nr:hypothetical protein CBR_g8349 [Chara braunii]|eukprot:GBG71050.1 hypothetical protein CBR_g8349 [Chara braunii]